MQGSQSQLREEHFVVIPPPLVDNHNHPSSPEPGAPREPAPPHYAPPSAPEPGSVKHAMSDDMDNVSIGEWSEISFPASLRSPKPSTTHYNRHPTSTPPILVQTEGVTSPLRDYRGKKLNNSMSDSMESWIVASQLSTGGEPSAAASISSHHSNVVPFSWAEITKIQPAGAEPIRSTPQLTVTAEIPSNAAAPTAATTTSDSPNTRKRKQNRGSAPLGVIHESDSIGSFSAMDSVPEADPLASKHDLGRRSKRVGRKGSRIKWPNGKTASRRNQRNRK